MLTRFDPLVDLERIGSELFGPIARWSTAMPLDAFRHEDSWTVRVDLPGVDPSTVDLTVDRNVLRIEATRNWQPGEGDQVLAIERPRGTFTRQLMLGEDLDPGAISADYRDGVLTVTLPVAEAAKPKKVAITTSGPSSVVEVPSSHLKSA